MARNHPMVVIEKTERLYEMLKRTKVMLDYFFYLQQHWPRLVHSSLRVSPGEEETKEFIKQFEHMLFELREVSTEYVEHPRLDFYFRRVRVRETPNGFVGLSVLHGPSWTRND